jgi:hypothetical protein
MSAVNFSTSGARPTEVLPHSMQPPDHQRVAKKCRTENEPGNMNYATGPGSTGNLFFNLLPEDAIRNVFTFLKAETGSLCMDETNDRAILTTSGVCRSWKDNVTLGEERGEASIRLRPIMRVLREYPRQIVQVFRNHRTPIFQLPVLNSQKLKYYLTDDGDDFASISVRPEEMNHPVMRFRDRLDRPGIALKIRLSLLGATRLGSNAEDVLVIFRSGSSPISKYWSFYWMSCNEPFCSFSTEINLAPQALQKIEQHLGAAQGVQQNREMP